MVCFEKGGLTVGDTDAFLYENLAHFQFLKQDLVLSKDFPWAGLSAKTTGLGLEALFTPLSWLSQTVR